MSRLEQIKIDVAAYANATEPDEQRFYARLIIKGCHITGESLHKFLPPAGTDTKVAQVECPHCGRSDFKNKHALRAHIGRKHKAEDSSQIAAPKPIRITKFKN